MGRIVATVDIENFSETGSSMKLDALVDTGAIYLTLPSHWKSRLGAFASEETVELQTATQEVVQGTVCGPVKITVEGFRSIYNEVLFIDMKPEDGKYEPLLGYIALEQCGAAVDNARPQIGPGKIYGCKIARNDVNKEMPWLF